MNLGDYQKRLHIQGDSYKQMVLALRAFANEMLFDDKTRRLIPGGVVHCGRSMRTSAANRHLVSDDVTPDLIIRPSPTYGVIAECKWGVPRDAGLFTKHAKETAEQLEKYDDDLVGWPTGSGVADSVASHDLVLLVNHEDSKRLAKELSARRQQGGLHLTRNFAVIGVGQFKRADGFWTELDLEEGRLADPVKTEKLSARLPINPAKLASNPEVALVELSDTEPPLPVMMELVHKAAITNLSREQHEQHRLDGQVKQRVDLAELCSWARRFSFRQADARDAACPRQEWIRAAMSAFVAIHWAEQPDPKVDEWEFLHKRGRRTPYARFIAFCAKRELRAEVKARDAKVREQARQAKARAKAELKAAQRAERDKKKAELKLQKAIEEAPLFAEHIQQPTKKNRGKTTNSPPDSVDR